MDKSLPILVTLLAPFAAAMAAYLGHVVVRGTKVSELRQKWIDDQRSDLAIIVSRAHVLVQLATAHKSAQAGGVKETRNEKHQVALEELEEAAFRVHLRENPGKPEWTDVLQQIVRIRSLVREPSPSLSELQSLTGCILSASRYRLKAEWNLVRDGEPSFKRAHKIFASAVAIITLVAISVLLLL